MRRLLKIAMWMTSLLASIAIVMGGCDLVAWGSSKSMIHQHTILHINVIIGGLIVAALGVVAIIVWCMALFDS